jgi:hypothetical protein|tara:strand:- start:3365 stop:3985 length:621 start_codon:yes stop_codon:yes gene_type:complete
MDFKSVKERSDMILEPLQVMIELSLLSHCPVGTKLSVSENILRLQQPTLYQGVLRWYKSDNKDDLYYLFHAIRRYYKWYKSRDEKIFNYILTQAIKGIDKLMLTYSQTDKTSITHTLSLYKNVLVLEDPKIFTDSSGSGSVDIDSVFEQITTIYDKRIMKIVYNILLLLENETNEHNKQQYILGIYNTLIPINLVIRKWIHEKLTC